MKKSIFLCLMISLGLAACQNDKAPAAKASAEPTSTTSVTTDVAHGSVQEMQQAGKQKQTVASTGNAVAVTKPTKSNTARSLQAALHQTGTELKTNMDAIKQTSAMTDKPNITKQVAPQPSVVKEAVVQKITKSAVKSAPIPAIATKIKTAAKAASPPSPIIPAVPVAMPGDAAKGKSVARKCKACHNFTAKKKVGPGLKGVFGRKAGIAPGMKYSSALAAGGWVWNEKNLALWVCDSKKAVKTLSGNASAKTKMGSQHICNAEKQANLIAFLKTL